MTMLSDVNVKSLAASGSINGTRSRVKGMIVTPEATAGSVVLKDGGASGTTVLTIVTVANGQSFNVDIPGNGVLFSTDAYATLTNASVTVFYG